ncbi:DNA helicase-2 / ATP-dependent DNA helicase PcrA [Caminicella sporogenes DSM 14501]|uniref:DNA 3'-5' helicase n=1 Tax=Caminicella sporogenes DSM 14501 TaxID=1121266 RepID=A0A1M6NXT9_9FIRM|nr:ATP-dependent helicase [Caminicella sporogenes]RKD21605.1 hypothetical protein BET04_07755 [Caminicella sporogenes]SHK00461.1 DNA helicase-2 / ATP-dependent DNA helicase PcrA [Caminicella sporogenes DSM 14501]
MGVNFFNFLSKKFNLDLNEKQKEAVTHKDGPVLVLASPGSGKTTVLNARIAYLILNCRINPRNILAITFSKAAARDMNDRFYSTYGNLIPNGIKFATIHSFAYKIVREYFYKNNINYDIIEGKSIKKSLLKTIYNKINSSNINDDKLEELSNAIGFVKNLMINPNDIKSFNFQIKNFEKIFKLYEIYKRENEFNKILLDFDDMLVQANNILKKDRNILNKYQRLFKYILVDEAQDTSLIQNKIIEKVALPENNLFMVCDDDQSIFRFRGADPDYLLDFRKRYKEARIIFMQQNYRSTKNIVDVSNKFIQNNFKRYPKNMFTANSRKSPIRIMRFLSDKEQINYIVNSIKKEEDLREIAILYRNNISSMRLAQRLYEENILFYMKDYYRNFFNHWVLNDILNFIRFSYDDTNVNLLESIYTKFNSYISKKELEYLKYQDKSKSVFDNLINNPEVKSFKKRNLAKFKRDFEILKTLKPVQAIRFIRNDLKYDKRLQEYCEIMGYSYDYIKNILEILEEFSVKAVTMQEYVDNLNNLRKIMHESKNNKYKNAVTLSTLHSSKGLEFKKVYMIDLIEGQIPTLESIRLSELGNMDALEEERRLWYVGMTRAKEHLELLTVEYKYNESVMPSRFIGEVAEHVEKGNSLPYRVNSIVRHKKLGLGLVKSINGEIITIDFDDKGEKNLSIDMCIKRNLLEVINYKVN